MENQGLGFRRENWLLTNDNSRPRQINGVESPYLIDAALESLACRLLAPERHLRLFAASLFLSSLLMFAAVAPNGDASPSVLKVLFRWTASRPEGCTK